MSIVNEEKRNRIKVTLWSYAYEIKNVSLVSDAQFDATCKAIDLNNRTDRPDLDKVERLFHRLKDIL